MVIGGVASGKTAFLLALLGEMQLLGSNKMEEK